MQFLSESADGGTFEGVRVPALDSGLSRILLPTLLRDPAATCLVAEMAGRPMAVSSSGALQVAR